MSSQAHVLRAGLPADELLASDDLQGSDVNKWISSLMGYDNAIGRWRRAGWGAQLKEAGGGWGSILPWSLPAFPPLSFSLLIVHLESDLLLPLTFIQPILGFTVVSDWMPQMTVSQNTWNPGPKFIQFPKWSLQLFCDISNKIDSYSLNPICSLKYFIFIYWFI